jgi:hypothetical protein
MQIINRREPRTCGRLAAVLLFDERRPSIEAREQSVKEYYSKASVILRAILDITYVCRAPYRIYTQHLFRNNMISR